MGVMIVYGLLDRSASKAPSSRRRPPRVEGRKPTATAAAAETRGCSEANELAEHRRGLSSTSRRDALAYLDADNGGRLSGTGRGWVYWYGSSAPVLLKGMDGGPGGEGDGRYCGAG